MGSPESEPNRKADEERHQVTLTRGFQMGKYPVTRVQWEAVMRGKPSEFRDLQGSVPVEQVSWNDCQEFITKLNTLVPGGGFRLPTEAEWEYACRAGTEGARYGDLGEIAWYQDNSGGSPHPVGQKKPNDWGLYDMLGNVLEWCADLAGGYPSGLFCIDPRGPRTSSGGVIQRGSSCSLPVSSRSSSGPIDNFRAAERSWSYPSDRSYSFVLRLARTLPSPPPREAGAGVAVKPGTEGTHQLAIPQDSSAARDTIHRGPVSRLQTQTSCVPRRSGSVELFMRCQFRP
jgi:formylglycine-generating enzyme required for sulfatase activity